MIKFDSEKLRIELHDVKQCTTAFGGSIRVVDHDDTSDHEVYKRIPVPMAIVRAYKKEHKKTKYLTTCLVAVTFYEDRVVALERHPQGCAGTRTERRHVYEMNYDTGERDLVTKEVPWKPISQSRIETVTKLAEEGEWFFDGRYAFKLAENSVEEALAKGTPLTEDHKFRVIKVEAIGLHNVSNIASAKINAAARTCLAYTSRGQFAISPPIWKDVESVGRAKIARSGFDSGSDTKLDWNKVDRMAAVNLSFAMKAASDLSKHFGFDAIEPLNLPDLMVRLNTVNLPKVSKEVKATFDSGIKFTHALAWLLGFARRAECMESYSTVRGLLKYLTTRGMFFRDAFSSKAIYNDQNTTTVEHRTKEDALERVRNMTDEAYRAVLAARRDRRWRERSMQNVQRLVDSDDID